MLQNKISNFPAQMDGCCRALSPCSCLEASVEKTIQCEACHFSEVHRAFNQAHNARVFRICHHLSKCWENGALRGIISSTHAQDMRFLKAADVWIKDKTKGHLGLWLVIIALFKVCLWLAFIVHGGVIITVKNHMLGLLYELSSSFMTLFSWLSTS